MDILSAHRMFTATQVSLKGITRDFATVKAAADTFVKWTSGKLQEGDEGTIIEVQAALPQKRIKKNKGMAGEMAQDEALSNTERAYEVNVHNIILDTARGHPQALSHSWHSPC